MKIEIKSRWTGTVLFSMETESWKLAVEAAVKGDANLRGANLGGADLRDADLGGADLGGADLGGANLGGADLGGADLGGANLGGADLRDADLGGADLRDADLGGADLRDANLGGADLGGADLGGANLRDADLGGANLRDADLRDANLRGANLGGADLGGANLGGANLGGANLGGANLRDANLSIIRDDLWAVLSAQPREVEGLRAALVEGRVDGSTYEGECACLVGTLANVAGINRLDFPILKPNSSRPIERFFLGIKKGDTPENCQPCKLALEWVDQWLAEIKAAFGPQETPEATDAVRE